MTVDTSQSPISPSSFGEARSPRLVGETTPIVLHREGRGVHAGRDPKHARQAGHINDRGDSRELLLPDVPGPQIGSDKLC